MIDDLVAAHEQEAISGYDLVVASLRRLDPAEPATVLEQIPGRWAGALWNFIVHFDPSQSTPYPRSLRGLATP